MEIETKKGLYKWVANYNGMDETEKCERDYCFKAKGSGPLTIS